MRSRLLSSFLYVLIFWWLAAAFYWSVSDPRVNYESLQRVAALFPWVSAHLPAHVNVLKAWGIQKQVLADWSFPLICATLVIAALGAATTWLVARRRHVEREARIGNEGEYRGISLTLGPLPPPQIPDHHTVRLRATDSSLQKLSEEERLLLGEVLGLLAANKDAFAGEGQEPGSLMSQTLKASYRALKQPEHPGLAAIAAAARSLGKITAWQQDQETGSWQRVRPEARESARLLAGLPSWWEMDRTKRLAVLFAVKYYGHSEDIPEIPGDSGVQALTRALLLPLQEAATPNAQAPQSTPSAAVEPEPAVVYEKLDPDTEVLRVFDREISVLPFQTYGLPRNIPAAGWKKGRRAYLLEYRLTESLYPKLSADAQAQFAPSQEKVRIQPFTAQLLKVFASRGWLVTQHGNDKVKPEDALWVITAGKHDFSRVIVLDLPEDLLTKLPSKDSMYDVVIKRPLFVSPMTSAVSKEDLFAGMLRPKTSTAKPAAATTPSPKSAG